MQVNVAPLPATMNHQFPFQPQPILPPQSIATATRKRKRAVQPPPQVHYRSEQHVDGTGRIREVIVIEDTPPPTPYNANNLPPPAPSTPASSAYSQGVRTRAQAAAAAAAASTSGGAGPSHASASSEAVPASKRRRKEVFVNHDQVGVNGTNGAAGPSASGAYARKALASRAYETHKQAQPLPQTGTGSSWAHQNSGSGVGSESVRASQVSQVSVQPQHPVYDDKDGYYIITPGDTIGTPPRYRIVKLLGQGTFGKVVEAQDLVTRTKVAVKIIRAIPKYRDASKIEIRVLKTLKAHDPANNYKCIHLIDWFDHRNHICIVSELLGLCIYDFLRENDFQPFPRRHIQDFARQILESVAFLHDLSLVHTDLKPENILLVHNGARTYQVPSPPGSKRNPGGMRGKRILDNSEIRLIDFGSATFEEEYHPTVVSTRHYRAPEIILGLGWSYPCDAFSVGCILVEFYTGYALFQTHDNLEHLAMMEVVMGKMPVSLARQGLRSKPEFFKPSTPQLDWPKAKAPKSSLKDVKATKSLKDVIKQHDIANVRFLELVKALLHWEPSKRMTVREALKHPFFDLEIPLEI